MPATSPQATFWSTHSAHSSFHHQIIPFEELFRHSVTHLVPNPNINHRPSINHSTFSIVLRHQSFSSFTAIDSPLPQHLGEVLTHLIRNTETNDSLPPSPQTPRFVPYLEVPERQSLLSNDSLHYPGTPPGGFRLQRTGCPPTPILGRLHDSPVPEIPSIFHQPRHVSTQRFANFWDLLKTFSHLKELAYLGAPAFS